jgi:hypothetical protein
MTTLSLTLFIIRDSTEDMKRDVEELANIAIEDKISRISYSFRYLTGDIYGIIFYN